MAGNLKAQWRMKFIAILRYLDSNHEEYVLEEVLQSCPCMSGHTKGKCEACGWELFSCAQEDHDLICQQRTSVWQSESDRVWSFGG